MVADARGQQAKHPARERFETERRRAAFLGFLPMTGIGIIAFDTWLSPWMGVPGGLLVGATGYAAIYGYESLMWRREHGA